MSNETCDVCGEPYEWSSEWEYGVSGLDIDGDVCIDMDPYEEQGLRTTHVVAYVHSGKLVPTNGYGVGDMDTATYGDN